MKIIVVGSKEWTSYSEVMRQMTVLMEDMKHYEDNHLTVIHTGSQGAENMITEYIGKVERFLRQKNFSIKEHIFKVTRDNPRSVNDYNMISAGADYALVFMKSPCKRSEYCVKMFEEFGIPVKVIKD